MATPSLLLSRRDLDFQLYDWLDIGALTRREHYAEHSRETFDDALDLSERIAQRHFATHNKKNDQEEPWFDGERVHTLPEAAEALGVFAESGLLAASMDEEFGGMGMPHTVATACFSYFHAANVGTSAYPFLTLGNARLLCAHGSREQVDTYVRPMLEGRFFGTMCLSEPQAGSSLADVATRAEERPDGTYRLFGTKMWISGGDHELAENIVHLVLARIPGGPPGVKGLSLFIVPKHLVGPDGGLGERNDVVPAGLNHKMGYRGTTNALLNFGEGARHRPGGEAGAVGHLVGEPHRGLAYMFHMMNGARIGVGAGAMALGYTGYLKSLRYARERPQGRPLSAGGKDASAPQVPIIEHTDVRRMLLAQKSYVEGALGLLLYCSRLVDEQCSAATEEERARAGLLLDVLTPLAKGWPSQWCLEANSLAIQVHGGYGYTREYDVEQHYRDNRLNPIHEGTHGIQGLDLLGRKAVMHDGAGLRALGEAVAGTLERAAAAGGEAERLGASLRASWERVTTVTARLWEKGDPAVALANSSVYLEAVGHVVVAWIWLGQFLATGSGDDDFLRGKRQAARYFFHSELPRTGPQFDLLESLDTVALETDPAWL
ncbi:acyl-CoA dehydrogenase [Streptomyces sp. NBC_01795]|uniref:acyl-CoA dehydrogenase n=1 Tax=unclassified Streptomyces TaxID=2593676 RepID=UPI002DD8C708|nr:MULTISPECIES: acyl-CoA dehydrogenase [unclassified Streptomyces]WSA91046.1 acyl-CoA dehydrogenase [Streptomyces sp. NBC_01795]WSS16347.1 acyl-CoA dehydrogenase [Streptomyces sp. NBC_01186]